MRFFARRFSLVLMSVILPIGIFSIAGIAIASHSWGPYHWARTSNPFTVKLGDNASSLWDPYLAEASADWSLSNVLDTNLVSGQGGKNCRAKAGTVQVCNRKYGFNGWLGIAQIWVNGTSHITQGLAKMNDSYFNTSTYNTPGWRRLVMCQEVAHTFGLDHQDESFGNPNLGTCMDYTSNPDGPPSNGHPNAHDYEQLELIYAHLDSSTTLSASLPQSNGNSDVGDLDTPKAWGKVLKKDHKGRPSLYERDLGKGHKVFTFVFYAE